MRKTLLLLALLIIVTACGKKEIPANLEGLKAVDAKGQQFLFRYNFTKGEELKYKLTTINDATETIKADSLINNSVNENSSYTVTLNVLDIDKDSIAELNVTVTSIDLNSKANGKEIKYTAPNKLSKEEKLNFVQYEALYNNPFRIRVNGKGEVVEVTRIDKIIEKIVQMRPPEKPLSAEDKATLTKQLSEQAVQPLAQQLFRLLPAKKLAIDSTWNYAYPNIVAQLKINNNVIFTFKELLDAGDKIAKVAADMKTSLEGSKTASDGKITAVFDDPKISGGGTIFFNLDRGVLQKSETFTDQQFRVVLTNKEQGNKKVERTQHSKNKMIVEMVK